MRRSEKALSFAHQPDHDISDLFTLFFGLGASPGRSGEFLPLLTDLAGSASSMAIASALGETKVSVTTDKDDYAPGATATITASGFDEGATVTFEVDHVDGPGADGVYGSADDQVVELGGAGHDPWTVTDGGAGDFDGVANGTVVTSWYVNPDDSLDERFLLSASDGTHTATHTFTDALPSEADVDLTEGGGEGTIGGAIFTNDAIGAGTGLINSFVRLNANTPEEEGYNTSARPLQFDENSSPQFTRDLQIEDIPIVTIEGVQYFEFQLDINEPNTATARYLSLDDVEIYVSDTALTSTSGAYPGDLGTLVYDMDPDGDGIDQWVALNYGLQSGSGVSDMVLYVPVSAFDGFEDDDYVTFYSKFGEMGSEGAFDWTNNSGFEEWSVREFARFEGIKFHDINANGANDSEPVLDGWEIRAYVDLNEDGNLDQAEYDAGAVTVDFTDAGTGAHSFSLFPDAVLPGTNTIVEDAQYLIVEVLQNDWNQSYPGSPNIIDPGLTTGGETFGSFGYVFNPGSGDLDATSSGNDFGNFQLAQISGFKFEDLAGDGAAGTNPPIADWTISLYKDDNHDNVADPGEFVASDDTDGSGFYEFTGLVPGDYLLVEETPTGWTNTTPVQINLNTVNSGANLENNNFFNFDLFDISGTKFEDTNGDGLTAGDSGLGGWTIFIDLDDSGTLTAGDETTTTAADGSWSFTGLDWTYDGKTVYEVNQSGWAQTLGAAGHDIVGTSGNDQTGLDFANFDLFDISGHKWNDANGNAMWDEGELGLGGWTIFIDLDDTGTLTAGDETTTTAADGSWSFTGLDWTYAGKTVYEVQQIGWTNTWDGSATIIGTSGTDQSGDFGETEAFNFGNMEPNPGSAMTPGFWKNHIEIFDQELESSPSALLDGVNHDSLYEDVFDVELNGNNQDDFTLEDALGAKGGMQSALLRSSTASLANAASTEGGGPVNFTFGDSDSLGFGVSEAFGIDPLLEPVKFQEAYDFVLGILEIIDEDDDLYLSTDEIINVVQDLYFEDAGDTLLNTDDFDSEDINDVAKALDAMNNMPHEDADAFA